jgi:hypothetical protein
LKILDNKDYNFNNYYNKLIKFLKNLVSLDPENMEIITLVNFLNAKISEGNFSEFTSQNEFIEIEVIEYFK